MPASLQHLSPGEPPPVALDRWSRLAPWALAAVAAVVSCTQVFNFDIFWHLQSGQWMFDHQRVLGHDPFSTEAAAEWVNVHWVFQLLVTLVHHLSGWVGLGLLKMALFAATVGVLAAWQVRQRISAAWVMLAGLWLIVCVEGRVRVRPELLTFLLLTVTLIIVESVRRGSPVRRLWWLAAVNLLWVNMHGLFVIGPAVMWTAVAGEALDRLLKRAGPAQAGRPAFTSREAVLPLLLATAACFVSPWPAAAALHWLLLRTRISGETLSYSFGVEEFRPTYLFDPLRNVPLLLAILMGLAAFEAMRARRRQVPAAHWLWLLMFLVPAATAIRNVALFVFPAAFLLTLHGGEWLRALATRHAPLGRLRAPAAVAMLILLAAGAWLFGSEAVYRWENRSFSRTGFGLAQGAHPVAMAAWLGELQDEGDILPLDFGDGGTFIYYSWPRRKVWMDGRLEAHSQERFERLYELRTKLLSPRGASDPVETPLPPSVRFVVARYNDMKHIEVLSNSPRFQLQYVDQAGVCFARIPQPGEHVTWKPTPPPRANIGEYDRPLDAGKMTPLLPRAQTRRTWYRQNPLPAHFQMGLVFYALGLDSLAVRYLTLADRMALAEPITRTGMLAQSCQRLSEYQPVEPDADLPCDPNLSRALALYGRLNLADLRSEELATYALVRVRALVRGRQIDAAAEAIRQYLDALPIPQRWRPPEEVLRLRDEVQAALETALQRAAALQAGDLPPAERALLLLRKDMGLIDHAIRELSSAGDLSPRTRMLLGDLYLRQGRTAEARAAYQPGAGRSVSSDWQVTMRLGLCDWADGNLAASEAALASAAAGAPGRPQSALYLGLLREQLGHYAGAAQAVRAYKAPATTPATDQPAERLLAQLQARLRVRGVEMNEQQ